MKIEEFISKRQFLYHLTDIRNFELIKTDGLLLSTVSIIEKSNLTTKDREFFLRNRRKEHTCIEVNNHNYFIRDQRPISIQNLSKCLTHGWNTGDFLFHLNKRVFLWPTIKRLESHYLRYKNEYPIIIRVSTEELFCINSNIEFCRLNSGATRSNSYLNGAPPSRGSETFLSAKMYDNSISSVAEVTFPDKCQLPKIFSIGETPNGPWREVTLDY